MTPMTLALTTAHATSIPAPFNAGFYVTAATVIPVLYLALVIQGGNFLDQLTRATEMHPDPAGPSPLRPGVLWKLTLGFVIYAAVGELFAIFSLYDQQPWPAAGPIVLTSFLIMLFYAAARPVLDAYFRDDRRPDDKPFEDETI